MVYQPEGALRERRGPGPEAVCMSVFDIVDVDADATVASCVCPTPKPKPKRKRQLDGPTRVIGGWEAAGVRSRSRSVGGREA